VPKPYPREFGDDVVRVARNREPGVTVEQIAKDFGVHPMTLFKWKDHPPATATTGSRHVRPHPDVADRAGVTDLRGTGRGDDADLPPIRCCTPPLGAWSLPARDSTRPSRRPFAGQASRDCGRAAAAGRVPRRRKSGWARCRSAHTYLHDLPRQGHLALRRASVADYLAPAPAGTVLRASR